MSEKEGQIKAKRGVGVIGLYVALIMYHLTVYTCGSELFAPIVSKPKVEAAPHAK